MTLRILLSTAVLCQGIVVLSPPVVGQALQAEAPAAAGRLGEEVERLVGQLIVDRREDRQAAYDELLELASPSSARAERVLELLPPLDDQMPPAMKKQLNDLRIAIEKRLAESAVNATLVTLDTVDAPLESVLSAIELQTENKLQDNREQFGQQAKQRLITLKTADTPFWEAMDAVLDQAEMDIYAYSGEEALALVNRDEGAAPRAGIASYAGPFRIAVNKVHAIRNLRLPSDRSLNLELEVAWEPRLRPIALTQKLSEIVATNEKGARLALLRPEQSIDLELSIGSQATELQLPLVLPKRSTERIATLRGTLEVLAPGRNAEFRFEKLSKDAEPTSQKRGGVRVTLAGVRKNNAIWEVHMRLQLDQPGEALASHRGWVYDNKTYLLDENGQEIDHAGFETTMQTKDQIGLAYLFDREEGIEGLTWVYETPASVHRFPVDYELKGIVLP